MKALESEMQIYFLCFLLYLLIGSVVSLCMILTLGRGEGDEVEIGLVTLFWPVAIVLDSVVSIVGKVLRFVRKIGRQIHKWSEPLIERLRSRNA
jgi:hypothetical protein